MDITIHGVNGSVMSHPGLADHLNAERHLAGMDYEICDAPIPDGEYGAGDLYAVRSLTADADEYGDDEYDVAEVDA